MTVRAQAGNVLYNHTEHTAAQKTLYLMNTINHNQKNKHMLTIRDKINVKNIQHDNHVVNKDAGKNNTNSNND